MGRWDGRVAIITGGARGAGQATARVSAPGAGQATARVSGSAAA